MCNTSNLAMINNCTSIRERLTHEFFNSLLDLRLAVIRLLVNLHPLAPVKVVHGVLVV